MRAVVLAASSAIRTRHAIHSRRLSPSDTTLASRPGLRLKTEPPNFTGSRGNRASRATSLGERHTLRSEIAATARTQAVGGA